MKVLLVSEQHELSSELESAIVESGHEFVARVAMQSGFVQRLAWLSVDLIILSVACVTREMVKELQLLSIPVVIFAAQKGEMETDEVIHSGVSAYVVDGFKKERVAAVIELAQARFKQVQTLTSELTRTRQELEERKDIDRAKGIIMKQKGCGEDDAYRALRKTAMDQNKRVGEVAKNIVSLAGLLG